MVLELFQNELIMNSAAAGIIVIAGIIIAHFFSKAVGLAVKKFGLAEKIKQKGWPKPEILIEKSIRYVVYALAIIAALNRLGIFKTIFNIVIIVVLAIILILLILNFKDLILNAIASLTLHEIKKLKPGKRIEIDGVKGEILNVGWSEVKILTDKGNVMIYPNSYLLKRKFKLK